MPISPNILWISFEDSSPRYGCYGDSVARTPHVDRLAAEGTRWTNAFAVAGVCAPARSAIITGMYPTSIGAHHMRTSHTESATPELATPYATVPPHYVKCFPEYLRAAGYYCTNNVKTDYQFPAPITAWDECSDSAHWRNRSRTDQPFFAVFNLGNTHESCAWPEKTPELSFDPDDMQLPPYYPDTFEVRTALARVYTQLERADARLGELLSELEADGLADNTIVVHWSDHGPLPRGKRWPYDAGIRVPLIVRWPGGLPAGEVREELVSTIDLGPTMLSLAGLAPPGHMQGRDFLGRHRTGERDYVYASRDRYDSTYDMVRAVRDRRLKYIRNFHPELPYLGWVPFRNRHPILSEMYRAFLNDELEGPENLLFADRRPPEELYDIEADPHEIHNLAEDPRYRSDKERLRGALEEWMRYTADLGEESEEQMVARFYPSGRQPQTAPVVLIPLTEENPGLTALRGGSRAPLRLQAPAAIQLHSATQGASIAYRFGDDPSPGFRLYGGPLRLKPGVYEIESRAIRIGYAESPPSHFRIDVHG
jgi:arylsulfatase A-like enzyme